MYRGGYFGFAEPLEFTSVIELVEFYQTHSLQPYSPKLDITLMEPVSKQDFDENEVGVQRSDSETVSFERVTKNLKLTEDELKEKNAKYNKFSEEIERTTQEIQSMRLEMAAQEQIIQILKEHLTISEKLQNEQANDVSKPQMISNFSILKRRYQAQEHSHKTLEAQLHRIETQKNSLDIERNILKPIIKSLQEQKQQQTRFLTQKGYRVSEILAEGADEDGVDDLYATYAMLHTYRSKLVSSLIHLVLNKLLQSS
jgi:phosphoinositide-3-kinase regulatory subunit